MIRRPLRPLKSLNVQRNEIGDEGAVALVEAWDQTPPPGRMGRCPNPKGVGGEDLLTLPPSEFFSDSKEMGARDPPPLEEKGPSPSDLAEGVPDPGPAPAFPLNRPPPVMCHKIRFIEQIHGAHLTTFLLSINFNLTYLSIIE